MMPPLMLAVVDLPRAVMRIAALPLVVLPVAAFAVRPLEVRGRLVVEVVLETRRSAPAISIDRKAHCWRG